MEKINIEHLGYIPVGGTGKEYSPHEASREIAEKVNKIIEWIQRNEKTY